MDHKKRFVGWRRRMPPKTQYLVDQVMACIVPEFEKHGFVWYPDFARNDPQEIGANTIPLQRREGEEWPTVEIIFVPRAPNFQIYFSALPEICKHPLKEVPRSMAIVGYGPANFRLCKSAKSRQCSFGHTLDLKKLIQYFLNWRKFLDSEVDVAVTLLPYLFEIFDKKLYRDWLDHPFGYVNEHVFLLSSWKIREDLERKRQSHAG
jgi:hypothetical protein